MTSSPQLSAEEAAAQTGRGRGGGVGPLPPAGHDDPGAARLAASPRRSSLLVRRLRRRHRRHGLRADPPQPLEQAFLRRAVAARSARLPRPARRVFHHRRRPADPECGAALAGRDVEAQIARGARARPAAGLDAAAARFLARQCRRPMGVNPDQRMHEDARKLCELSVGPRHGTAAGLDSVRLLRRHSVGAVERLRVPHSRPGLRGPGLHGVGRRDLRGRRARW